MVEIHFQLPGVAGNPFDFIENDVAVDVKEPGGRTRRLPAFFDGGATWRVRYTPGSPGKYAVAGVVRNGNWAQPEGLAPSSFNVAGVEQPGFVRRDPLDARRFVLDNGQGFYPIGCNAAWGNGSGVSVPGVLEHLARAGGNWSRIWMDHWDGKNLDWVSGTAIPQGALDLGVARKWDGIVQAAEKNGIRFQMVLQHHGPYSSKTDSNWKDNPWNAANGGFLAAPEEFFTSPRAIALTRAKYRYILARWGYSPSVMAWELFNEVQWTDAITTGRQATVAKWHDDMAAFLRAQDPYHHLITSSFKMDPSELGTKLDYWQPHAYVPDPVSAITALNGLHQDRPAFLGEIGPASGQPPADAAFLHRILWSSMMTEAAGAAQLWAWDDIEAKNMYPAFRPATAFLRWSGLAGHRGLAALPAALDTPERGALAFSPGAEWETAKQTEYTVAPSGDVPGIGTMPRFLQGNANRAMFPYAAFHVAYAVPGTFRIHVGQASKAGASVVLSLDGKPMATREFPPTAANADVDATLEIPVPAGAHTVRLENTGADWDTVTRIALAPYASRLGALAKGDGGYAVVWVYRREETGPPVAGTLKVLGLKPGAYRVRWWDTAAGTPLAAQTATVGANGTLAAPTPPVERDIAALIQMAP